MKSNDVKYEDILYVQDGGVARITINRPDKYNAFRSTTCEELIHAFNRAAWDNEIGVIVFSGAGGKAFCTGGDQSSHGAGYGGRGVIGLPIEDLHTVIRDVPKPVIASVNGYAIGGGNVLAALCDLTICSDRSVFGQVGPKVGSVDPGYGTAYLAAVVGEKKAREIWYLCRRYSADEAVSMGLANLAVAEDKLQETVDQWSSEILERSPTALSLAKRSFNAATESIRGISSLGMQAVALYYKTEEAQEGGVAFQEKRKPDFRRYLT